jgi:FdhD protein
MSAESLTAPADALHIDRAGQETPISRPLVREHRLVLKVDGEPFALFVCTREALRELVLGRLCTAGRIARAEDVAFLDFSEADDRAAVRLRPGAAGRGDKPLEDRSAWRSEDIFRLYAYMHTAMPLHDATQGTHGCLLLHRGSVLCCYEDIGRHNAIDKAVGGALERGVLMSECILYSTGRIAAEVVEKTARAGICVLATRALPTAEAVEKAGALGMTLIGRAWEEQYEVFASRRAKRRT